MLIIGATGTSGKLAVAAARQAGAGRIVAAGRRLSVRWKRWAAWMPRWI
ncbi:hypothetical protein M8494_26310 [Serratia ureilytica]